jgi:tight adherence protein B
MGAALAASSHEAFWSSSTAVALVVGACALVVGLTVAYMLYGRRQNSVRARVERFVSAPPDPSTGATAGVAITARTRSPTRERFLNELTSRLELARIDHAALEIVNLTLGCSLFAAVLFAVLVGTPAAGLVPLLLGPLIARTIINQRLNHQRIAFGEQLPSHLQELAASMRSGRSMVSGIALMADDAAEPTRGEFQRVMADEELGMPLADALGGVVERMDAPDMEQVSLVAEIQSKTGGNMAEVLDRVADSVRERAELNRELRTLTAQARLSRWIITALPPGLLLVIAALNPSYLSPLFDTTTGHILLIIAIGLMMTGSWVMGRIVKIEA